MDYGRNKFTQPNRKQVKYSFTYTYLCLTPHTYVLTRTQTYLHAMHNYLEMLPKKAQSLCKYKSNNKRQQSENIK